MFDGKPRLVEFGFGGHTVYHDDHSTLSGYDNPDTRKPEPDEEGIAALDLRPVLEKEPYLAIESPMVDVSFQDEEVERFAELVGKEDLPFALAPAMGFGAIGALAVLEVVKKTDRPAGQYGPLDSISLPFYLHWWREHGAPIGTVKDGAIQWEEAA